MPPSQPAKTNKERQAKFAAEQKALKRKGRKVWCTDEESEKVKALLIKDRASENS